MWPVLVWIGGIVGAASLSEAQRKRLEGADDSMAYWLRLTDTEKGQVLREMQRRLGNEPLHSSEPDLLELFDLVQDVYVVTLGDSYDHYVISVDADYSRAEAQYSHAQEDSEHVHIYVAEKVPNHVIAGLDGREGYEKWSKLEPYIGDEAIDSYDYMDHPYEMWPRQSQENYKDYVRERIDTTFIKAGTVLYTATADPEIGLEDLDEDETDEWVFTNSKTAAAALALEDAEFLTRVNQFKTNPPSPAPRVIAYRTTEDLDLALVGPRTPKVEEGQDYPQPHPVDPTLDEIETITEVDLDDMSVSSIQFEGPKIHKAFFDDFDEGFVVQDAYGEGRHLALLFSSGLEFVEDFDARGLVEEEASSETDSGG